MPLEGGLLYQPKGMVLRLDAAVVAMNRYESYLVKKESTDKDDE